MEGQPKSFRDVSVDRRSGSKTHRRRQCEWQSAVTRESRYGIRVVRTMHPSCQRGGMIPTLLDSLAEDLGVVTRQRAIEGRFQETKVVTVMFSFIVVQIGRLMNAVLQVQSLVGVSWRTLAMMKLLNGVHCLLPPKILKENKTNILFETKTHYCGKS